MNYQVLVFQLCFHFNFVLVAVINGLAKWLLLQFGAKKKTAWQRRANAFLFDLFLYAIFHILNYA